MEGIIWAFLQNRLLLGLKDWQRERDEGGYQWGFLVMHSRTVWLVQEGKTFLGRHYVTRRVIWERIREPPNQRTRFGGYSGTQNLYLRLHQWEHHLAQNLQLTVTLMLSQDKSLECQSLLPLEHLPRIPSEQCLLYWVPCFWIRASHTGIWSVEHRSHPSPARETSQSSFWHLL